MPVDISSPLKLKPVDYDEIQQCMVFTGPQTLNVEDYDTVIEKAIMKAYGDERRRRTNAMDDYLHNINHGTVRAGEHSITDAPYKMTAQELYFNTYGGKAVPYGRNWVCPHCGLEIACAIPPETCPRCRHITYYGEMVRDGVIKR